MRHPEAKPTAHRLALDVQAAHEPQHDLALAARTPALARCQRGQAVPAHAGRP